MWISGPTQNFGLAMGWSLARLLIRKQDNWLISGLPYRAFNAELLAGEKLCAARALIANSNFSFWVRESILPELMDEQTFN